MKPKAILCDVIGTLVSLEPLGKLMKDIGLSEDEVEFWEAKVDRDGIAVAAADGYAPIRDVGGYHLRMMLNGQKGGKAQNAAEMDKVVAHVLDGFNDLVPYQDLKPAFKRLTEAGIKVSALTNGAKTFVEAVMRTGGLDAYMTTVCEVAGAGFWKPRKEAYLYAAKQLKLAPHEVMLAAMHPWDCNGAKNAGLQVAYVNRTNQPYPDFMPPPDVMAADFEDLVTQLIAS